MKATTNATASTQRCPWFSRAIILLLPWASGCDIRIGQVQYLWALWGVPVLAAFFVYAARRKTHLTRAFASPELIARLAVGASLQRQIGKTVLILLAFACAILALAQPKWGFTWEEVHHQGVDLVVALDVSESMLVQDAAAGNRLTRLEQAKREIIDLLKVLSGDRVALVAFAGTAFVECPLTIDYNAAAVFLDDIDTDLIAVKGTDLAEAIDTALKALQNGAHQSQGIILITDGEDLGGGVLEAAQRAQAQGVRIFTIGIGRSEGAPIPSPNGGFHRDASGNLVLSRLDEATLEKIAFTTGGRYVHSVTGEIGLENLYQQSIKTMLTSQTGEARRRQRWHERFQWLLAVSVIALALEALLPERLEPRRGITS